MMCVKTAQKQGELTPAPPTFYYTFKGGWGCCVKTDSFLAPRQNSSTNSILRQSN